MPLDSAKRRELIAAGHRLKAKVIVKGDELSDAVTEHVRRAFGRQELLKVRIATDDREACARAAEGLAERVPCELVQLVGRVALLYRPSADAGEGEPPSVDRDDTGD